MNAIAAPPNSSTSGRCVRQSERDKHSEFLQSIKYEHIIELAIKQYLKQQPTFIIWNDEMYDQCVDVLIYKLNRDGIPDKVEDFTKDLNGEFLRAIQNHCDKKRPGDVGDQRRTRDNKIRSGRESELVTVFNNDQYNIDQKRGDPKTVGDVVEDEIAVIDEILTECCKTKRHRQIVNLRIEGYTQAEVAKQLGICRKTVNEDLKEILRVYDERNPRIRDLEMQATAC
jgi:hypothetical protein